MIGAHFVRAIAQLLHMVIYLYTLIVLIRSVMSWMGNVPLNQFTILLRRLTDPVFRWVHRNIPFTIVGNIDISPILILVALYFLDNLIYNFLMGLAAQLANG